MHHGRHLHRGGRRRSPHVLDERSEERTYDDLLLRRSLGDKSMQLLLEPGRTVTITHGDDTHTPPPRPSACPPCCGAAASVWVRTRWWS